MSFLDKKINSLLDWNSVDISVKDMAAKLETLFDGSTEKELKRIARFAKKSWVLDNRGHFASKKCSLKNGEYQLVFDYSVWSHLLVTIRLSEPGAKTEYFIPKGRDNAKKLQSLILAGLAANNK